MNSNGHTYIYKYNLNEWILSGIIDNVNGF